MTAMPNDVMHATPGPWSVHPRAALRVIAGDDRTVCSTGSDATERDRWEANARLIADAPAMHLALALICAGVAEISGENFNLYDGDGGGAELIAIGPIADTWTATINAIGWDRAREALAERGSV